MPKGSKKCLPADVLQRMLQYARDKSDTEAVKYLEDLKTCRKPSAYNQFIGECMGKGKNMKDCAAEYRKGKK